MIKTNYFKYIQQIKNGAVALNLILVLQASVFTGLVNAVPQVQQAACALPVSGVAASALANKNDGNPAPVPVADDSAVRAGAQFSFTDNGDGTITDNNTGLMWEKKTLDGGLHDKEKTLRWSGDGSQETVWD